MTISDINPVELKVFLNHIYEFKKGVRQMVLYTTNKKYEAFAVKRLTDQKISYVIQPVGNGRINLFLWTQGMHRSNPSFGKAATEQTVSRRRFHTRGNVRL